MDQTDTTVSTQHKRSKATLPRQPLHSVQLHEVQENRRKLAFLPLQLQRKIAYYLSHQKVYAAEELDILVDSYPLEYLCVELHLPKEAQEHVAWTISRAPELLEEVVVPQLDYNENALLVKELLKLSRMECLSLQLFNVDASRGRELVEQLCSTNHNFHFLDLDFSGMSAEFSSILIHDLVRGDKSLTYLDLRSIPGWKDVHKKCLCALAPNTSKLSHFKLVGVELREIGIQLLVDALAGGSSLHSVVVGDGPIGDDAVILIGEAIARNKLLQRFRGYGLGMTPEGAAKFATLLAQSKSLAHLTLGDEDVGVKGAKAFAKLLETSCSIRTLSLNYCNLGEAGCHWITNAAEKSNSLEELELMYNDISDSDATCLLGMGSKPWWCITLDETRVIKPFTPRRPILAQKREAFKNNFREYLSCI